MDAGYRHRPEALLAEPAGAHKRRMLTLVPCQVSAMLPELALFRWRGWIYSVGIESPSGRYAMANREQKKNKEKKKPKADKNVQTKSVAPAYIQPELVRKPRKEK
jgi:hypothetical protein